MYCGKFVEVRRLLCGEGALLPPLSAFWENQTQTARLSVLPTELSYRLKRLTSQIEEYLFTTKRINTFYFIK